MKIYIKAMAFPKSEVLNRANRYSQDVIEHIIKIIAFSDIRKDDVSHWINELATWFRYVGRLTVKPNSKKLKVPEIRDSLFRCVGDDLGDFEHSLVMFNEDNRKGKFNYAEKEAYPEIDVTTELSGKLMDACYDIMGAIIPMLSDRHEYSMNEYKVALKQTLDEYM